MKVKNPRGNPKNSYYRVSQQYKLNNPVNKNIIYSFVSNDLKDTKLKRALLTQHIDVIGRNNKIYYQKTYDHLDLNE